MTDLRARIVDAVEAADEPLTTLQLAGDLNRTIWQIQRTVNTLELSGAVEVKRQTTGMNRVAPAGEEVTADV